MDQQWSLSRKICARINWREVYAAQKGTINSTLSVMAGRAFRLMSKGLSEREIWTAFEHAGLSKGLTQEEVINTLRSARDYGIV